MYILFKYANIIFMTKMLNNKYFLFIYNKNKIRVGDKDFSKPR